MPNRGGFSWKRAVGVTPAKQRVSQATGIPWTRSGRQRKLGRIVGCGCVVVPAVLLFIVAVVVPAAASAPNREIRLWASPTAHHFSSHSSTSAICLRIDCATSLRVT